MTKLIDLADRESACLSGGLYWASNTTNVSQRNGALNAALALGGPSLIVSTQSNRAAVFSLAS